MNTDFKLLELSPTRGTKYSPRLYNFLRRRGARPVDVFRHEDGSLWIGSVDGDWFRGSRLTSLLAGVYGAARGGLYSGALSQWKLKPVKDFWPRYREIGRCVFDPDHTHYFVGDASRYVRHGRKRVCQWCGHTQTLKIRREVIKTEVWITATEKGKA